MHDAIKAALAWLSYEDLPKKERPPKSIWLDADKIRAWWAEVERNREAEMKGEGSTQDMERNAMMDDLIV